MVKILVAFLAVGAVTVCVPSASSNAFAQANTKKGLDRLSGEIEFEGDQRSALSPQKAAEDSAKKWLSSVTSAASAGQAVPSLDDSGATYMGALYLYCLKRIGVCPFVLTTILEADITNAYGVGTPECPSMSRFWKAWLRGEMEQRSKFLLSIASGPAVADFNMKKRPAFVKCKGTVATALQKPKSERATEWAVAIKQTNDLVKEIDTRGIDLFATVGLSKKQEDSDVD